MVREYHSQEEEKKGDEGTDVCSCCSVNDNLFINIKMNYKWKPKSTVYLLCWKEE